MGSFQQGPLSQKDFLRRKRGLSSWLPAWVLKWVLQGKSQGDPCDPPRAMHDHDRPTAGTGSALYRYHPVQPAARGSSKALLTQRYL